MPVARLGSGGKLPDFEAGAVEERRAMEVLHMLSGPSRKHHVAGMVSLFGLCESNRTMQEDMTSQRPKALPPPDPNLLLQVTPMNRCASLTYALEDIALLEVAEVDRRQGSYVIYRRG